MKSFLLPLAALAVLAAPMAANAAACRDAHGRFTSCSKATTSSAAKPHKTAAHMAKVNTRATPAKASAKRCKIGSKFASCSAPGAKPV